MRLIDTALLYAWLQWCNGLLRLATFLLFAADKIVPPTGRKQLSNVGLWLFTRTSSARPHQSSLSRLFVLARMPHGGPSFAITHSLPVLARRFNVTARTARQREPPRG